MRPGRPSAISAERVLPRNRFPASQVTFESAHAFPERNPPWATTLRRQSGYSVRDDDLQQRFAEFGTVTSAKVMMGRDTGRPRASASWRWADAEAQAAVRGLTASRGRPRPRGERGASRKTAGRRRGGGAVAVVAEEVEAGGSRGCRPHDLTSQQRASGLAASLLLQGRARHHLQQARRRHEMRRAAHHSDHQRGPVDPSLFRIAWLPRNPPRRDGV
jgi:hypothetical protein